MSQLAVDLGTSRTRVGDASGRVLVDEPSVAGVDLRSGTLVAYGTAALSLSGRSAGEIGIVRPVVSGQLQDLALTDQVADSLLDRVRRHGGRHPELLLTVPGLATGVQRRALEKAFKKAGAAEVDFIEQAVAAGIGFGLRIDEPVATMVVDAGAGTTDVAVMALGGVVTESSVPVGGDDVDGAIREFFARSFDLVVSRSAAEALKLELASAWPGAEEKREVRGRDAANGAARTVVISSSEIAGAIAEVVRQIGAAVVECIVTAPPDLANDLLSCGLHLTGGGGCLRGLARRLANDTGIPVHVAEDPGRAAVVGAARCIREISRPPRRPAEGGEGATR